MNGFFQKPQVQALLWRACGASGFIGAFIVKVCHYYGLPVPDVDVTVLFVTGALTTAAEWTVAWYRNNPNNMIRKLVLQINGTAITQETKAAVAEATATIPGVVVHVDTSPASPAPAAVQALTTDTKAPDVVSNGAKP